MDKLTEDQIEQLKADAVEVISLSYPELSDPIVSLCREVLDLRAKVDRLEQRSSKL